MCAANLGKMQSVLVAAMRCLDCRDPRCVGICPEHVDVREAMQMIASRSLADTGAAWIQNPGFATISAAEGIQTSFEFSSR